MGIQQKLHKYIQSVAGKFAITVTLVSFAVGFLAAASIAWVNLSRAQQDRVQTVEEVFLSGRETLLNSLWMMDNELVETVITGLANLPGVEEASVVTDGGEKMQKGSVHSKKTLIYEYRLQRSFEGDEISLGVLSIVVGLDDLYRQIYHHVRDLVALVLLIALGAGGVTVFFFHKLVGQHLRTIAEHSANLRFDNLDVEVSLKRRKMKGSTDELEQIVTALNSTCHSLHQSLQEIQSKESMFEDIVTTSSDMIFRLDPEGNVIYANPAAEAQMENVLKAILEKMVLPKIDTEFCADKNVVSTTVKIPHIQNDQQMSSYSLRFSPEMSPEGGVRTLIGIAHDITVHNKEMEFLRAIFAHAPVLMTISDMTTGYCSDLNEKFAESTGYSRADAVGLTLVDLGFMAHKDEKRISQMLEQYGRVEDIEIHAKKASGREMICRYSCQIITVEGEQKILSIAYDITLEKQMEKERETLQGQLTQSSKMEAIGTLAGGIAHDFNNILSVVLGFTELALDSVEKDNPLEGDLQEIYAAGSRAKELVSQILTFARQSDEELKPIHVDFIIKEVLKFIRSSIPTTIGIKQDITSSALVLANATQLHRIIMNLCTNAAYSMEKGGGELGVSLKDVVVGPDMGRSISLKPGNYVEIKVSDVGEGIDPLIVDRIFEPYFTTKKAGEGTGMGLAMVHGIVETYGGQIFVESKSGEGTVFSVYLPVARGNGCHQQYRAGGLPTGQERILFVDDELQIVTMADRMLSRLGYSVTTMTSSVEALEFFRNNPDAFDLLISDVTMPEMSGDQLAQEILEIIPNMPIILCTGYSKTFSEEAASQIGVKAFAYKPIVREDLAQTVRDVLNLTEK